ncbi:hypothetical protein RDWZM_003702 [Blomia tropicalis]|uniref:Cytochrome b-c1 complex subunit 6 n=1 Tax=Blomia tropicalis TaxID=40697 RepID=A0A9Q0MGB7_BLOTA|nr:hypothetical protein BLOT_002696 [Blomia tropicalis]KAJ6225157.1 hypothetical protein RDWZM_003702 [Blomia tropicalis]
MSPVPKVFAEEPVQEVEEEEPELIDPQETLREECTTAHCQALKNRLEECNSRVSGKKSTTESCFEEVVDFMNCVDHCVGPKLFAKLK